MYKIKFNAILSFDVLGAFYETELCRCLHKCREKRVWSGHSSCWKSCNYNQEKPFAYNCGDRANSQRFAREAGSQNERKKRNQYLIVMCSEFNNYKQKNQNLTFLFRFELSLGQSIGLGPVLLMLTAGLLCFTLSLFFLITKNEPELIGCFRGDESSERVEKYEAVLENGILWACWKVPPHRKDNVLDRMSTGHFPTRIIQQCGLSK